MQSFFKEHFQLNVFQKLWDWRLEKFYMRNHTCPPSTTTKDLINDTITIGPEGKFNWVLQLINSQKVRLFDRSRGEVQHETFSQPTQPIPKPIRDRSRQPEDTQSVIVVKGETSRSPWDRWKSFSTKKLCASDGSGQLEITLSVIEARNLSENTRVVQIHDGSRQPDECNSSRTHTVKEQHAPDEHREIASFNTNNEFNRAINEENIDFNIPGVTAFYSETITLSERSRVDSENRESPESARSSMRLTSKSIIQCSQSKIKKNDSWSWERWNAWTTRYGTQSTVQSMSIILGRRHRLLHVRLLLAQRNGGRTRNFVQYALDLLSIPN